MEMDRRKGRSYNNVFPQRRPICRWKTICSSSAWRASARSRRWDTGPTAAASNSPTPFPRSWPAYGAKTAEELTPEVRVRVAGRIMTMRHMGKAGFAHLQQNGERLQIYVKKDAVGERDFQLFKMLDIGDIIGVEGYLFRTRTGELSIHVGEARVPLEDPALHARKVARPGGRGNPLPPALSRSDRQPRGAQGLRHARAHRLARCAASSKRAASSKWKRP